MLRLHALTVENFGPFKGQQTIEFQEGDGVTIVYGDNMRGKTSLLNAIRFAFFGKILGRSLKPGALHNVGNWEKAAEGRFGFSVALDFSHEGRRFRLERVCLPKQGVRPMRDEDYQTSVFLRREGKALGPDERTEELERILPEQISRFFLFDGELLQEYEGLLSDESGMGRKISEAIERILGVPVLTHARSTVGSIKVRAEERVARASQGDQKTRELGIHYTELIETRTTIQAELARQEAEVEALRTTKALQEEEMRRKERVTALFEKHDGLNRAVAELEARLREREERVRQEMGGAWCTLLAERMQEQVETLRRRQVELLASRMRAELLQRLQAGGASECPTCFQELSPAARQALRNGAAVVPSGSAVNEEQASGRLQRQLDALTEYLQLARSGARALAWEQLEECRLDLHTRREERDELQKELDKVDEESFRKLKFDFEATVRQIQVLEDGIGRTRVRLGTLEQDIERVKKSLARYDDSKSAGERRHQTLCSELHQLLDQAVGAYRDQLRKRVERDATAHFRRLTTEPDYVGLTINQSYGLTIAHRDGAPIPVRSAGAEHVVALSLMGALQNNAPLRGPIIIDSPFGRLDQGHTRRVVRALPEMAQQVVLLVYEGEMPVDLAREELQGRLLGEWRLERRTARHTELVRRKD